MGWFEMNQHDMLCLLGIPNLMLGILQTPYRPKKYLWVEPHPNISIPLLFSFMVILANMEEVLLIERIC